MQWVCEIALSDSQTAFKSLYLAYFQRLMRFTSLYVPSSVEAEEIVSDTFLSLWNNRKSLPEISNFDSYIYGIARHKAISLYRTQHMEKVQIDENTIDLFAHTDTTPEEELISKECIDHLNEAINTLPDKCKMAFKLIREDKMKAGRERSQSKDWLLFLVYTPAVVEMWHATSLQRGNVDRLVVYFFS